MRQATLQLKAEQPPRTTGGSPCKGSLFCSAQPENLLLSPSAGVSNKDGGRVGTKERFLENLVAGAGLHLAGVTGS